MFRNFELKVDVMTRAIQRRHLRAHRVPGQGLSAEGIRDPGEQLLHRRIRTGSLYHVQDVLDISPAKDDVWFTEHIIVKDKPSR